MVINSPTGKMQCSPPFFIFCIHIEFCILQQIAYYLKVTIPLNLMIPILLYYINEKYFLDNHFSYYSPCHYMRAWIRVLDAPGCYESVERAERKSALQGLGLVRTVGPCAQRRVALMPRAITIARDALSNDRRESAMRFERPAKQSRCWR